MKIQLSIREDICEILQFEGFEVIWSENGEKGLEKAKTTLPNLILSDISMPLARWISVFS